MAWTQDNCVPFKIDATGGNLFWPFGSGSSYDPAGWGSYGYAYGEAGHAGSDYYAIDWSNRLVQVCDSPFYAPLAGKVVAVNGSCPTGCFGSRTQCGDYGNQIIIQSSLYPDYYFRVAHLKTVFVSHGDVVQPRQLIGKIGSTGNSTGPHAHCVLYKVPDSNLSHLSTPYGAGPDKYAVPYNFAATCGTSLTTGIEEILVSGQIKIYPNPVHDILHIVKSNPSLPLQWAVTNTMGSVIRQGKAGSVTEIDLAALPTGMYILTINTQKSSGSLKLLKL